MFDGQPALRRPWCEAPAPRERLETPVGALQKRANAWFRGPPRRVRRESRSAILRDKGQLHPAVPVGESGSALGGLRRRFRAHLDFGVYGLWTTTADAAARATKLRTLRITSDFAAAFFEGVLNNGWQTYRQLSRDANLPEVTTRSFGREWRSIYRVGRGGARRSTPRFVSQTRGCHGRRRSWTSWRYKRRLVA